MSNWSERLRRLICWLMIVMVGVVPFVFCWLSDELFEFNKMQFVYAGTTIIACLYVARMVIEKRLIWQKHLLNWPLGIFLLSQIISTVFSMHPRTSWLGYYTRLNGGLLSTLTYLVIYLAYLNNFTARERRYLINVLLISSSLVSLYAIGEHFGQSFSCYMIKGQFDVSCWVQDVKTRVYATLGQPNWLAAYNVTVIGLITVLILHEWSQKKRFLAAYIIPLSLILNFCSLLFTKSRSGIVAFGLGLVTTIVFLLITWIKQEKSFISQQVIILALTLACFFIPALVWGTQYTPALNKILTPAQAQTLDLGLLAHLQHINTGITDSGDIRKIVWRGALDIWRHYPLFGTGVETFAYSYYAFRPTDHNWTSEWDFLYNKAHNELLNLAANSGTFGLLSYLSIFGVLAFVAGKYLLTQKSQADYIAKSYWYIGIISSLVALSVTNFFGFSTVSVQVLLYLFLAIAASLCLEENQVTTHHCVDETWQSITFITITIAGLTLLSQVWKTGYADFNYARCKNQITRNANEAIERCSLAISLRPHEALYKIDLGNFFAQYAYALIRQNPSYAAQAQGLIDAGLKVSDLGMALNPNNLNFYKTRYLMFSTLAGLDPEYWAQAEADLLEARRRSPTDPKLVYYYGQVKAAQGDQTAARDSYEQAVSLRPLYLDARLAAAAAAEQAGDYKTAYQHYLYAQKFLEAANLQQALARTGTASGLISEKELENQ